MYGKCYIYKRANLVTENGEKLVDYQDGTIPFNCQVHTNQQGRPVHRWNLYGEVIEIPLNVSRTKTDSILRNGVIPLEDGSVIEYEYIFGKYISATKFYTRQLLKMLPFLILTSILTYLIMTLFSKRQ